MHRWVLRLRRETTSGVGELESVLAKGYTEPFRMDLPWWTWVRRCRPDWWHRFCGNRQRRKPQVPWPSSHSDRVKPVAWYESHQWICVHWFRGRESWLANLWHAKSKSRVSVKFLARYAELVTSFSHFRHPKPSVPRPTLQLCTLDSVPLTTSLHMRKRTWSMPSEQPVVLHVKVVSSWSTSPTQPSLCHQAAPAKTATCTMRNV